MKKLILAALFSFGFCSFAADQYKIDPAHASVVFKIGHMAFSNVYGMFGDVSGDFTLDEQKPDLSKLDLIIKADSVDTMNAKRNEHLRKPDFFDVKQYPTISFKSQSIKKHGNKYEVTGLLTLHGVTKPLHFELTRFHTGKDPMGMQRTGGEAKFHIKRSDYGMNFMVGPSKVTDDVEIWVSVEGIKS